MVERVTRAGRVKRLPRRALLPVLLGLAFAPPSHADVDFTPTVHVKQTWTDNVTLRPDAQARENWVTEVRPGFALSARTPRVEFDGRYQFHRYFYSDKDVDNLRDSGNTLQAGLRARLVDDLVFLDASANRAQRAVSAFGPDLADNLYSTENRTEVSTWRISPYLTHRFGSSATLLARYSRDSVETGRQGYGNTLGNSYNLALSSPVERRFGWNLSYDRQDLTDRRFGDSSTASANAGLSWRVLPPLRLTAGAGYDDNDYQALGGRTRGATWNVGYMYTPSSRTSLSMSVGHRYFGKSRSLAALHRSRHTAWNISYDEAVTTTRRQFLLPATVDTYALLDDLFTPNYPDPVQRRQAIEAYLLATGLPPTLANDINYLSNRYLLQRQFQASAGLKGVRSTLLLSLFDTRREALSVQETDSPLLGNQLLNLNNNTRQRGLGLNGTYRVSSRASAYAQLSASNTESLTTGARQNNRAVRLGMHRRFERNLNGSLELRRLHSSGTGAGYTENAISATLSMTL